MTRIRVPGDLDIQMKLFGRFTITDLARIFIPSAIGIILGGPLLVAVGVAVGAGCYLWRPYGHTVDVHAYHCVRWLGETQQLLDKYLENTEDRAANLEIGDQSVRTRDGNRVGVVEVSPTNLDLKTDAEKGALHSIYQTLQETVTYPIQIHSRQTSFDLEEYVHALDDNDIDGKLKTEYLEHCRNIEDGDLTRTHHYIVVHTGRNASAKADLLHRVSNQIPNHEKLDPWIDRFRHPEDAASGELDSRCREIIESISSTDLSARRVTGDELESLARAADVDDPGPTPTWTLHDDEENEYRRTISIGELPSEINLGWPLQLLRTRTKTDVVQVIRPRNRGKTAKRLHRLSEKLNAEINSLLAGGHRGTNKLESLLEDVDWFLDLLADRQAQPVEYSCYIDVHEPTEEACNNGFEKVCNRLDTMGIEYGQPVFKTDLAADTTSPLHGDRLDNTQLMPATSAAAGFPFATQNTAQSGVLYGVDVYDGNPILLDRFNWSSHSMARMGMVGSGKSYAAKIELLRSALVYEDLQVIVVDPKQEYRQIIDDLDGRTRLLRKGASYDFDGYLNGYTVEERGQGENTELLAEVVEQIYSHVSQDQHRTLVIIDEARILLNDENGRRILNQFVLEGRDTNTAITLLTQNASHFTHSREGRGILDNMPGKIFMRHDRVPDSVVDYFELSQKEKQELFELRTGTDSDYSEALVRVSGRLNARLRVESTPIEHSLIEKGENQT